MQEEDIRPEELFNTYLSLAKWDVKKYFEGVPTYNIPCPACGSYDNFSQFEKLGFTYVECSVCGTLFVNPRPIADSFSRYYSDSASVEFWATHFYKQTEDSRRERIIKPKALLVADILKKYKRPESAPLCIVDIGAGYGIFCEEIRKTLDSNARIIAIEPASALHDVCVSKGISTINRFLEDTKREELPCSHITCATSFELLEHIYDPGIFIKACHSILDRNSLFIITTLNWEGFDLQMLGGRSKSIHPPHHINFFTPHSIQLLLKRYGFEILDISTPGQLDVNIVAKQLTDVNCVFIKKLLINCNDLQKEKIQKFLQESLMSSHMMVVARKK